MNSVLNVQNLTLNRNQQALFSGLNFAISPQERAFITGDVGAGKTSLLLALMGFIPVAQGGIYWFGKHCQSEQDFRPLRGHRIGLTFQNADDQLFGATVLDDVAFGALNQGMNVEQAEQAALAQLEKLDLLHLKDRPIHQLSGGEKNFTALAGVLVMQPKMLLLDEPTNGLDSKNQQKLVSLLKALQLPMLIASHDHTFQQQLADSLISLSSS